MTAKEAYELSKSKWHSPEHELIFILSDIRHCAEAGHLHLKIDGWIHQDTKKALQVDGYKVEFQEREMCTVISWRTH